MGAQVSLDSRFSLKSNSLVMLTLYSDSIRIHSCQFGYLPFLVKGCGLFV